MFCKEDFIKLKTQSGLLKQLKNKQINIYTVIYTLAEVQATPEKGHMIELCTRWRH